MKYPRDPHIIRLVKWSCTPTIHQTSTETQQSLLPFHANDGNEQDRSAGNITRLPICCCFTYGAHRSEPSRDRLVVASGDDKSVALAAVALVLRRAPRRQDDRAGVPRRPGHSFQSVVSTLRRAGPSHTFPRSGGGCVEKRAR